jgi:hypothetical protein
LSITMEINSRRQSKPRSAQACLSAVMLSGNAVRTERS